MSKPKNTEASLATKQQLIQAGIRLFSKYGYAGTSTRMIAGEVSMSMNAIQFHFGGKEKLYQCVLQQVAEECASSYQGLSGEVRRAMAEGSLTKADAWTFIERMVDIQLLHAIEQPNPANLALMYWEQMDPAENAYTPISEIVQETCEETLAALFRVINPALDESAAVIASRFINGGIISFGEHSIFLQKLQAPGRDAKVGITNTLRSFVLACIRTCLAGTEE